MIRHCTCNLRTGVSLHYVESVSDRWNGETLLLVHGFPDTWYGWRRQIPVWAHAGYRVIAPDMRGYGETTPVNKDDPAWYSMENITLDLVALLDTLLLKQVVLCGHDWGGTCVWNFALHYPSRVKGLIAFCTPFFPHSDSNPWPKMQANAGRFDYQLYFQTEEAEKEFEQDAVRTVKCMIRGTSASDLEGTGEFMHSPWLPTKDGGAMVKYPKEIQKSEILTDVDVEYYAWQFRQTGFFGILSWYRNVERNWRWNSKTAGMKVDVPCLMVTGENDLILRPSMTKHMSKWIDDLVIEHVADAGHWILQEQPDKVCAISLRWLAQKFPGTNTKL